MRSAGLAATVCLLAQARASADLLLLSDNDAIQPLDRSTQEELLFGGQAAARELQTTTVSSNGFDYALIAPYTLSGAPSYTTQPATSSCAQICAIKFTGFGAYKCSTLSSGSDIGFAWYNVYGAGGESAKAQGTDRVRPPLIVDIRGHSKSTLGMPSD